MYAVLILLAFVSLPAVCQRMQVFLNQGEIHIRPILIENRRILIEHHERIAFWDIDRSMLLCNFSMPNQYISGVPTSQQPVVMSATGKFLATATHDSVYIYSVLTQELSFRFRNPINEFVGTVFSFTADENYLVYSRYSFNQTPVRFLNTTTWDTVRMAPMPTENPDDMVIIGNHLLVRSQTSLVDYIIGDNALTPMPTRVSIDSSKIDPTTRTRFFSYDNDRAVILYQGTTTQVALLNLKSGETEKVFSFPFETNRHQWDAPAQWLVFLPDTYNKDSNQVTFLNLRTGATATRSMSAKMKSGWQKSAYGDTRMEAGNFIINCHDEKKIRGIAFETRREWSIDADIQLDWIHFTHGKILYRTVEDRTQKHYRMFNTSNSKTSVITTGDVSYIPLHTLSQTDKINLIEKRASNRYALGSFHENESFEPFKWMGTSTLPVTSRVVGKVGASYVIKLSAPKTAIDETNEFWDMPRIYNPLTQTPGRYVMHEITTGENGNLETMDIDHRIASEGYFNIHYTKNEYGYNQLDSIALVDIATDRMVANVSGQKIDVVFGNNKGSLSLATEIHFTRDKNRIVFLINSQLFVLEIQNGVLTELRSLDLQKLTNKYLSYPRLSFINNESKILVHESGISDNNLYVIDLVSLTMVGKFLSKSKIVASPQSYPHAVLISKNRMELWNVEANKIIKDFPWANQKWMMNSARTLFNDDGTLFMIHEASSLLGVYKTASGQKVNEWSAAGQVKIISFRGSLLYGLSDQGVPFTIDIRTKARTNFKSTFVIHQIVDSEFLLESDSLLLTTGTSDINIWNLKAKNLFRKIFLLDSTNLFVMNDSLHYRMGKENMGSVLIRSGRVVSEASQIDLMYNRPSVFATGKDPYSIAQRRLLDNAYKKRLRVGGVNGTRVISDLTIDVTNKSALSSFTSSEKVELKLAFRSERSRLVAIHVLVNDVPVTERKGFVTRPTVSKDTTISLLLGEGYNRVEVYGVDSEGKHSNHFPLHFQLTRPTAPVSKIYFIGIGIDRFADPKHNLNWSVKDIRDLAKRLKAKMGESIVIDTLFNECVTIENVLKMKLQLLKSSVDDKVIVAYSGHGLLSDDMDYFLSTYWVDFSKPEVNGLPYTIFETLLDNIPARKRLMLIDACHSGELDPESIPSIPSKKGNTVIVGNRTIGIKSSFELMKELFVDVGKQSGATIISAASGTQFANEYDDLKNGVFTYSILEAMSTYSKMTVNELKRIVSKRVDELTSGKQQPTFRNEMLDFDWEVW